MEHNSDKPAPAGSNLPIHDIFLFSHARTLSNVLAQVLIGDQPDWTRTEYHFMEAFLTTFRMQKKVLSYGKGHEHLIPTHDEFCEEFQRKLQEGFDRLEQERAEAKAEGKHLFVKNHTVLMWQPANLYQTSTTSSSCRTVTTFADTPHFLNTPVDLSHDSLHPFTTFRHHRKLYSWFALQHRANPALPLPLVIDADDILTQTCLPRLCAALPGLDPTRLQKEWSPRSEGHLAESPRKQSYLGNFHASKGIDPARGKSSEGLRLEECQARWKDEFGEDIADTLARWTEAAMRDYEELKREKI